MAVPTVVYFNIDDTLEYESSLLRDWEVDQQVRLVEVKTEDNSVEAFIAATREAAGVVVEYFQMTREVISQLPNLKIIGVQSIGYNNIDVAAATEHGVAVVNAPGFCVPEVALHTVGLLIDLVRKISFFDRSVRTGRWDPLLGELPHRLEGKTVGLVFFGGIPQRATPMLQALGLKVLAWAPTKSAEFLAEFGVEKAESLDQLLVESDFVSLHTPLLPETAHLIGARELDLMRPSAYLINTARGGVVDEAALVAALRSGTIAGAGIDVIEDEDTQTSELFGLENVVITPHAAFISEDSFYQARDICVQQMVQRLVWGQRPETLVNRDLAFEGSTDKPNPSGSASSASGPSNIEGASHAGSHL
ncbi:MAG: C-terminal binding protein [Bifidobacteriaceae bacterium]|jgi:D-3-phosphoglycerate dehydrogenase|nr:C-terminal binding protein [Bifidobacteriaceae bacterium]